MRPSFSYGFLMACHPHRIAIPSWLLQIHDVVEDRATVRQIRLQPQRHDLDLRTDTMAILKLFIYIFICTFSMYIYIYIHRYVYIMLYILYTQRIHGKSGKTLEYGSFPTYVQTDPAMHHQMNRLKMVVLRYHVGMSKSKARHTNTD